MGTEVYLGMPPPDMVAWIKDHYGPKLDEPLCFTAVDAEATITFKKQGSPDSATIVTSTNAKNWTPYTFGTTITLANVGDKVYFRAADENDISFYKSPFNYYRFATTDEKRIAASGNIQTLMKADGSRLDISGKNNCYDSMFSNCKSLTSAPALPATTLASYCYNSMFGNCKSLTTAPTLPATTLADHCYANMLAGCTSLTTAPELPAMTLADYCYYYMFSDCTALTTVPALPATTLANNCCERMFQGCTSLTTAPVLLATTLANKCYNYMFNGCTSLTTVLALQATTLATYCCSYMFQNCTSLTTAPVLPTETLADHCYYYMFSGCTALTTVPALPATTLASYCYSYMFNGCTALTTAPNLSATTLANNCCQYMFNGCTALTIAPELPATFIGAADYCYSNMFAGCEQLTMLTLPANEFSSAYYCYDNTVVYGQYQDLIYFPNADLEDLVNAYKDYYIFGEYFDDFDIVCSDGQTYTMSMSLMETGYEFYDNYVYYHGPYSDHSESESDVIGEITSSEDDLNNSHSITIRFNGSELIHGFDEEITFNIDVDESSISPSTGSGYAGSLNEHELGCFNFWTFNQDDDDIWIRIPIQEKS